jgi:RNA polymerase sigma-70 factor (ECF subfamily)
MDAHGRTADHKMRGGRVAGVDGAGICLYVALSLAQKPDTQNGEVAALRPVVEAALRSVLGHNDHEHEDLVQCALEHALRAIHNGSYRGSSPLRMWAVTIARNVAMDALRSRSRDRTLFARDERDESQHARASADLSPERVAEVRRRCQALELALNQLPPKTAEIVYLHDWLGHPLKEVAACVGMSVAAAQSRLVRGRRRVLDWMGARDALEVEARDDEEPVSRVRPSGGLSPPGVPRR